MAGPNSGKERLQSEAEKSKLDFQEVDRTESEAKSNLSFK